MKIEESEKIGKKDYLFDFRSRGRMSKFLYSRNMMKIICVIKM